MMRPTRRVIASPAPITIDAALQDPNLLGAALGNPATWAAWIAILRAAFGLPLNAAQLATFDTVAGHRAPPTQRVSELWAVAGRRSGKSRMAAALLVFAALLAPVTALAKGEVGHVICISASRSQAKVVFGYALGFIESSPVLRQQVEVVKAEEIILKNNIVIGVHTSSFRTIRGRTVIAAVFDEVAYWRDETSSQPDIEIYRAVVPALAASRGMLAGISSPYRKIGLLHAKHRDHFGQDGSVLVVQSASALLNPTLDPAIIESAREADPEAARAEWDASFRTDLSSLLDDAVIDAAIDHSRPPELPRVPGVKYHFFTDSSAGRHDHWTGAASFKDKDGRIIIAALRGVAPPFDPNTVAAEMASLAKSYGCREVVADNFSAGWVEAAMLKEGVKFRRSDLTRSELYLESLPMWNRHAVSIPNHARLIRELRLLERRVHRSGKDSVDHGTGGSDDYSNSVCGAMWLASAKRGMPVFGKAVLERAKEPGPSVHHMNLICPPRRY